MVYKNHGTGVNRFCKPFTFNFYTTVVPGIEGPILERNFFQSFITRAHFHTAYVPVPLGSGRFKNTPAQKVVNVAWEQTVSFLPQLLQRLCLL